MDVKRITVAFAVTIAMVSMARSVRADDQASYDRLLAKPHTVAMLHAGIIALPTAPISASHQGGSTFLGAIGKGDATIETGVDIVFRLHKDWAFGAGVLFGPRPTSDTEYGGNSGLARTHSRSYWYWGVEGRWIPLHYRWLEGWVGLHAGEVIVGDRFDTDVGQPRPTILGTREVTIRSEGFATGIQAGADWLLTEHFVFGVVGRSDVWVLPNSQACSSIHDCATLSGAQFAFEIGLTVGYRIPL
jgi:hypothetical protein